MDSERWTPDETYSAWVKTLKEKYRAAQIRASVKVNSELIRFYWELGKDISEKYKNAYSGSAFFERLSQDLKTALGGAGFSVSNLKYMRRFYDVYKDIVKNHPQVVDDLFSLAWDTIASFSTAARIQRKPSFSFGSLSRMAGLARCSSIS